MTIYVVLTWFVGALIATIILARFPKVRKYIIQHDYPQEDLGPDEVVFCALIWPVIIFWPISYMISHIVVLSVSAPEYFVTKIWRA